MSELENLRVFTAFTMLSIATYYDIRTRQVNDLLWIVCGFVGIFLYTFDSTDLLEYTFAAGLGVLLAVFCWRIRLCGQADILALSALSVILPTYSHIPTTVFTLVIGLAVASSYAISHNCYRNIRLLVSGEKIFAGVDEAWYKKLVAFFIICKKNKGEKFGFAATTTINGKRKFIFRRDPDSESFVDAEYVTLGIPTIPFLLIGLWFLVMTMAI